ncbi:MAG: hypothetical protein FK732_06660 [Asgard group archaeon]|nr:hypothetical protein [Asgard group archaeon]
MKKSKILAAVMFIAMFSSLFTVANFSITPASVSGALPSMTPDAIGDPMGSKGVWVEDITGQTITIDGDLVDWDGFGARHEIFNGIDIYIGYDASNIYVALAWVDASHDMKLSEWNKTGHATLDNATHGTYDQLDGATDMVAVGFTDSAGWTDLWIWDASIRGDSSRAYEVNATWHEDSGDVCYDENLDTTVDPSWRQPDRTNNSAVAISDHDALANGTAFIGWFDYTPTGSQTDVALAATWNDTGDDRYVVEFERTLVAPNSDDIAFDFTDSNEVGNMTFWIGAENKQDCTDFSVSTNTYNVQMDSETNVAAEFEWDYLGNASEIDYNAAILTMGACYDDFVLDPDDFVIHLSGWDDTYGPGTWQSVVGDINAFTGDWSFLFSYNEDHMPLGFFQMNVSWTPKYDDANFNITYQNVSIVDNTPPTVVGLVDINTQYPNGVPNGTEYVTITVGANDDYAFWSDTGGGYGLGGYETTDMLSVQLFSWKDDDVALATPMIHFSSGATTFSADLDLPSIGAGETYNYTYFVEVWDTENNKVTSEHKWFIHGIITEPTPGFGILAGLFGLAAAVFIIYKKRK